MTLDELERLEREATKAMWGTTTWDGLLFVSSTNLGEYVCELGLGSKAAERDAALIAAARNALPALLRVARAARVYDRLLAEHDAQMDPVQLALLKSARAQFADHPLVQALGELRAALEAL